MTEILNTLSHRVYRDVDGEQRAIKSGGVYEGKADVDNGQVKADSAEAKAWRSAHGEDVEQDAITTDPALEAITAAQAIGGSLATARLRDPGADAETQIEEATAAAEEAVENLGQPIGTVATDPETGEIVGGQDGAGGVPSYAEGVEFASAQAENAADELVAAGKLDPTALKPGKGNGDGGAFKAGDVRGLAG